MHVIFQIFCVISRFSVYAEARYLDVVVDASGQNLITGVVEGDGQHLIGILESVDCPFLTDVPQLPQRQTHTHTQNHYQTSKAFTTTIKLQHLTHVSNNEPLISQNNILTCAYRAVKTMTWDKTPTTCHVESSPSLSRHRCQCRPAGALGGPGSRC